VVPAQVLAELFNVLVRKDKQTTAIARQTVLRWQERFSIVETSGDVIAAAVELSERHHLSIWDSIVVASTAEAGCRLLASEDLQDGLAWRGVTVVNPFATKRNALLTSALEAK
jgi:predicted nucleic acid-binding protein